MPIYEYKCSKCLVTLEVMHGMSEQPPKEHEGCGGQLSLVFSAPAVTYEGAGWARRKAQPE